MSRKSRLRTNKATGLAYYPELHQGPSSLIAPVSQQQDLNPNVLSSCNPVLALKLHVSPAGPHLPRRPHDRLHLLTRGQEVGQERRRLVRSQGDRWFGPWELNQEPRALRYQRSGIVGEPRLASPLRSLPEIAALGAPDSGRHGQGQGH
jgi:hypothetical protein